MNLRALLRPASIAVVGASPRTFVGQVALSNCDRTGFLGNLYPVGRHEEVAGHTSFASLSDLPEVPDLAVVQVRADLVLSIVTEGLALGVRGFVIPGAGFTDSGEVAKDVHDGLLNLRKRYQFDVVGPNCMGFVDLVTGAAPYVGTVTTAVRPGSIGVVAQSGAIVEAIVNAGGRVPISTAISSGSEAVTSLAEYLDFFALDSHTTAVLCFVEALTDAQATVDAAKRLTAAGKHLGVCVVGRSSTAMEGIAAHSGKLASGAKVMAAAFEQAGATIASDLDELLMLGEIFATEKIPAGPRMHVVTNSGGEGSLIADIAHDVGLTLPPLSAETRTALEHRWPRFHARNPLDPWGTDDYEGIYPEVLRHAADEPGDIVVVAIDQQRTSGDHEKQLCLDLATYLAKATSGTTKVPVMLSPTSQDPDPRLAAYCRQAGIALLRGARPALAMLAELGRPREVLSGSTTSPAENATLPGAELPLGEDEVLGILDQLGVSTPVRRRFSSGADAAAAYQSFDGPVVLKGVAPGLIHKTELGLVKTHLTSTDAVRQAATEMEASASGLGLDLEFLLAEMVDGDLEVVVGYKRDPMFGPTVMVGSGGVWAEFFDDVSVHVGEIDNESARRLVARSRVGQMLAQARGGALHVAGVEAALCAVSALGAANPDVVGIDVNPLIVGRNHATAVDAVIERRPSREKEHPS